MPYDYEKKVGHKFEEFASTLKRRLYTLHVSGYSHIINIWERERDLYLDQLATFPNEMSNFQISHSIL